MIIEHYYRFIPNLTRQDCSAFDKAAAQFGLSEQQCTAETGRSYGRNSKGLRARCPVTPRRVYGAADRIRTGDVQLGKLAFCH